MAKKIKKTKAVVVHRYPETAEWLGDLYLRFGAFIVRNKWVFWAGVALLCLAAFYSFPTKGADDYDIWFHLKYGQMMSGNFTWDIDHSQFSWTPSNPGWKYVAWVAEYIFYFVFKISSMYGLYVLHWAIFLAVIALYLRYLKALKVRFDVYCMMELMLMIVALTLSYPFIKPENFTVLFFAITVYIYIDLKLHSTHPPLAEGDHPTYPPLAKGRNKEGFSGKLYYTYPLLFLIWVNTHGGFFMGLFFLAVALCAEVFSYFACKKVRMEKKALIGFALSVVLSFAASLVNPHGIYYIIDNVRYLFEKEYGGQVGTVIAYYKLWSYLFPKDNAFRFINTAWSLVFMLGIFGGASWYAFRKTRRVDVPLLSLNIIFFFVSMQAARTSFFYPLLFIFSVHYTLRGLDLAEIKKRVSPAALGVLLYLTSYAVYMDVVYQDSVSFFGYGYQDAIPVKEVEYIKKNKLPGPIFNDYLIGGYMMWSMYPDYKVFIDPRFGPYVKEVFPDWSRALSDRTPETLKWFMSKYHFKTVLLHVRYSNLANWLLQDPEWRLVYFDKMAFVLVHQSVLPTLSREALMTDVSPSRFRDVTNPAKLASLFDFYLNIGPSYAKEIMVYYYNNVSKFYINRDVTLLAMKKDILNKIALIRQQQQQQLQMQKR